MAALAPCPAYIHAFRRPDKRSAIRQNMPSTAEYTHDELCIN
ncbi:hypothetical protein CIT292_08170 [Citrobacter youngae ATCC 29220]|uniref:Uncharacterized protein n=1 Tax=Citrobacter youngae ATCC 29220 TaxID=500640 RepID=D4BCF7_9ENTR|nr:hypothetical protein CIT292_08170 [Citrobacter youngae ATCC 29220]